jgi:hypothetical protein
MTAVDQKRIRWRLLSETVDIAASEAKGIYFVVYKKAAKCSLRGVEAIIESMIASTITETGNMKAGETRNLLGFFGGE